MMTGRRNNDLAAWAQAEREAALQQISALDVDLPLKYLRQQAHYTTPASNERMAGEAASRGYAPVEKILVKYQISLEELGQTLAVPVSALEALLQNRGKRAPLVVIDSEDAQALKEKVLRQGRENAVRVFREADWGETLRFYRPSGIRLSHCVGDIVTVLIKAGEGLPPEAYPIDGVVFPKVEQQEEIDWLCQVLDAIEARLGLEAHSIRVQVLVESGWAVANLSQIVRRALPRLAGIIFGSADYSADLALSEMRYDHPLCDWARAQIVNMAGAVGVPAIDAMTLNYPVANPERSQAENRRNILARLKECHADARHGIALGMKGKWVGHPAQLLVVLLAYRMHMSTRAMQLEIDKIKAYQAAVEKGVGATLIEGVMSDRATDRYVRSRLREAVALGLLSPEEGVALGVVTAEEAASLSANPLEA